MNKVVQTVKQWFARLFSKKTAQKIVIGGHVSHHIAVWLVATMALIASMYLIIESIVSFYNGQLVYSSASALIALVMIAVCIAVDRYASGNETDK